MTRLTKLLLALATLAGALTPLVAELRALRRDAADVYQQTALTAGQQAEDLEALRARIAVLELEAGK